MFPRRIAAAGASLLLLTLGLGCYQTKTPLRSAAIATVDRAYVGDFETPDTILAGLIDKSGNRQNSKVPDNGKMASLVIHNLDNRQYFVEYFETGDRSKEPVRMVGYTAKVKGVMFANLRELNDDGSIDDQFLIMRVAISPDHAKLSIRELKDEFFKDKDVSSSEALEKVIEANLDNDQMYERPADIFTRKAPTTQP